jgi:hypothetical protein
MYRSRSVVSEITLMTAAAAAVCGTAWYAGFFCSLSFTRAPGTSSVFRSPQFSYSPHLFFHCLASCHLPPEWQRSRE